jgi:hypothetical protein
MRILIPILLLIVGLAGGVGAGFYLGGDTGAEDEAAETATTEDAEDAGQDVPDGGEGNDALVTPASDQTEYVRLRNQFIVPVVQEAAVRSLVVLALTVEVVAGGSDVVFQHEPRLRDSFLRVLFAHANAGGFDGRFTDASAMAPLREGLRDAAVTVLGEIARDVLIVDITRQDA